VTTLASLMSLRGRTALITGAAGHIGRVMAETLAEQGADLVLVDREGSGLQAQAGTLARDWTVRGQVFECDLEHDDQRLRLLEWVCANCPRLSVLVNNAAFVGASDLSGWSVPFAEQTVATWRRALEVNLTAVFALSQGLAPQLASGEGGSIVNIGSIYGEVGPDWRLYEGTTMANPAAYAASKGGVIQLSRYLATTLAPRVRVNCICPGGVFRNQPEAFVQRYEARTPLGRMATEEDFRGAIAFFASDLSRYVTGQSLSVDGGWGVW
jgi:NAD(P)-dependent dehydrogenase (short-subunit alcohol dehydrogenase family)